MQHKASLDGSVSSSSSFSEWATSVSAESARRSRVAQLWQHPERRVQDASSIATSTKNADVERLRVRRWSITSSDELASEVMKGLTNAPKMLFVGMFLNPDADVKKIRQLPTLRKDPGMQKPLWQRPITRSGRISPDADIPAVPRDPFPEPISHSKSLRVASTAIQAFTRLSGASSSRVSAWRSTSSCQSTSSACSDLSEAGTFRPRARRASVSDVTRQKSVRTFAPSSRFGDPADWKKGALDTQRPTVDTQRPTPDWTRSARQ
ncbi:hypothetical protein T484DRAFT_1852632 [Baffinella frigidus]|nr:hypothetical protein T484DRAFT_1852632 [Cryptophyta sp. CCMP2293]